jgi:negative regulator of sigma E activity
MHDFLDFKRVYGYEVNDSIRFPKSDLSIIEVWCPEKKEWHDYKYEAILQPIEKESELSLQVKELERRVGMLETQYQLVKSSFTGEVEKAEKYLKEFMAKNLAGNAPKDKEPKGSTYG